MVRIRWARAAAVLVALVAIAGCGQELGAQFPPQVAGLDVFLERAAIRNGNGITVKPLPAGTLRADGPLRSMLVVRADQRVSIRNLVLFAGLAQRTGGGSELGVTGLCGRGWTQEGKQIDADPCMGANMAMALEAGTATTLHMGLSPAAPSGPVTPGTFHIAIPFNDEDGPLLELTYRVVEPGQAERPPWPAEKVSQAITFEPDPAEPDLWSTLFIRIEDGYGRIIDERALSAYKDDHPDLENDGVFTVDLPRGLPLNVRLFRRDGNGWVPCASSSLIVTTKDKWPIGLLSDTCGVP